jgi:hypothetical protein
MDKDGGWRLCPTCGVAGRCDDVEGVYRQQMVKRVVDHFKLVAIFTCHV